MMTLPIAMVAIKAIVNRDGRDQCNFCEMPKCSREEPLKCNKEGRGNQLQSHKADLSTNATRASWGRCDYHDNTIPRRRISPQGCQSPQRVRDKCKLQCFADQYRSQGSYAWCDDSNYHHCQHGWPGLGTNYLELIALSSQLIGVATEVYTWHCNSLELQPKELESLRIAACWVTKTLSPRSN